MPSYRPASARSSRRRSRSCSSRRSTSSATSCGRSATATADARPVRRLALLLAATVLVGASPAAADAVMPTAPVYDAVGHLVESPFAPSAEPARLTEARVVRAFLAVPKVAGWLDRYAPHPQTDATFARRDRTWTVHVWSGEAGEIATGKVADADGRVLDAWTGPQVAWKMAR